MVVGYVISLLLRSPNEHWTWLDGWVVCAMREPRRSLHRARTRQESRSNRSSRLGLGLSVMDARRRLLDDRVTRWEIALGAVTRGRLLHGFTHWLRRDGAALPSAMGRLSDPTGSTASSRDRRGRRLPRLCFHSILHAAGGSVAAAATTWRTQSGDLLFTVVGHRRHGAAGWASTLPCSCSRREITRKRHRRHGGISFRHRRSSRRNSL